MELNMTLKGFDKAMKRFDPRAVAKSAAMACNRAATFGRAQIVKDMRKEYTVQARKLRATIEIDKASMYNLKAAINVPRNPIALSWYQTKGWGKRGKPVQVQVLRGGGYKVIEHDAFVMQVRGKRYVVKRKGKERFPTLFVMGPSIGGAVMGRLNEPLRDKIQRKMNDEFQRALQYALDKGRVAQSGEYA